MLDEGEKLVPGFRQARALRVWTGVRPLFEDAKASDTDTRDVTRAHALLDHAQRDGVERLRDDHRRQADDLPADGRGDGRRGLRAARRRACRARPRPSRCPAPRTARTYRLGERLGAQGGAAARRADDLRVRAGPASQLEEAISAARPTNLDDIRRRLRLGHGPLPGRFLHLPRDRDPAGLDGLDRRAGRQRRCCDFLQERWKGMWPILYGDQLRQVRFDDWIFQGVLDVEHLTRLRSAGRVSGASATTRS